MSIKRILELIKEDTGKVKKKGKKKEERKKGKKEGKEPLIRKF